MKRQRPLAKLPPACAHAVVMFTVLLLAAVAVAQNSSPPFTSPLPTGRKLDAVGEAIDLGSMPVAMLLAPGHDKIVAVLSGWREQGFQVVNLATKRVEQTVKQDAAFFGAAFSPDGKWLYVSGGNEDLVYCYRWDGSATLDHTITLGQKKSDHTGSRYAAGVAVSLDGRLLYVAENVANSLAVVELSSGSVIQRFETGRYPYSVVVSPHGTVYVSAWDANVVSVFRADAKGSLTPAGSIDVGRHPSALLLNRSGSRLFAALASVDAIAVIDTAAGKLLRTISDAAPRSVNEGSTPNGLALSADGARLFVAEADNNAVAVIALSRLTADSPAANGRDRVIGRVPCDWYPTAVIDKSGQLLVLSGKGHGSHANPDGPVPARPIERPFGYSLGMLNGTLRMLPSNIAVSDMQKYSARVATANDWTAPRQRRRYPKFKHVIYIIKENRTYDQVLGDLGQGDGDPTLTFFGKDVAPNHHALALRFGNFDRFFTNAEVSSQGHIWSTAAYVTDYGEKLIPSLYSDRRADNDEDDVDAPARGFIWDAAKRHGLTIRDYGEWVKSENGFAQTRPGLTGSISVEYPVFSYDSTDQQRADVWIREFREFLKMGKMPQLEIMHLPMDHTAGALPGKCTPRACMADNDFALGRIVEELSKSPRWRDTVVFVVEDDAQAGPDHVDSHRAPFYVISAYNRPGVVHRFVNTTDVLAAIEDILHLGRLSQFDYFSRSLQDVFAAKPDMTPYKAEPPRTSLTEKNPPATPAAQISEKLDFSAPDRIDDAVFNQLLWMLMKGNTPMPRPTKRSPLEIMQISR